MSSALADLGIESKDIKTAPGVQLSEQQTLLTGCVLDLFAGRPSLKKLQLWKDDATFEDPITIATGRNKYEPQWYGLQKAFSEIERLHHQVNSSGNPIAMDLRMRYVVKGVGKEQTIDSVINIFYDEPSGKITKVEDKWDGKIPESGFRDAMRKLNSASVPKMVGVPKNDEEDRKLGN